MSEAPLLWDAPSLFLGLTFALDPVGLPFLALTLLLWGAASLYALAYHRHDPARGRLLAFWLPTFAGNLGLVLAADLLTFYLAFALMTFAGWGLVIHTRSREALRAGKVYLVLALLGEVALLAALLTLAGGLAGDGVVALPLGAELEPAWETVGTASPVVALLALAGFGVKAGLVPLHLWLPLAHPVAPTPASALLSGVMIKAGVVGWLRVLPPGVELPLGSLGEGLMVVGVLGAAWGVVCGLGQRDPKAILAYSSVSQMGYLALAMGMVLAAPSSAGIPLGALLLYALHHGVAKGALFLAVGVADRTPLGKRPWRWAIRTGVTLPALALAGAPLTSGAAAKEGVKEGLRALEGGWYAVLDPILLVLSGGTALLLLRFALRLEERGVEGRSNARGISGLVLPWGALVALGLSGPWWMGAVLPEGSWGAPLSGITSEWLGALLAIGGALVLAGLVFGAARSWPRMKSFRIPPGDLLIPMEALVRRLPTGVTATSRLADALDLRLDVTGARLQNRFAEVGRRDLGLMRGPVLATVLVLLVLGVWTLLGSELRP